MKRSRGVEVPPKAPASRQQRELSRFPIPAMLWSLEMDRKFWERGHCVAIVPLYLSGLAWGEGERVLTAGGTSPSRIQPS